MYRIQCSEIWGGIKNEELDICAPGLSASLYAGACDGGRGGDAYYFSVCGTDRLTRLVLADVCGHGEQVAAVSQWMYDQIKYHMSDTDQPSIMRGLNERAADLGFRALTTAVVVSYYTATGRLYYSNAGHPPMLARRNGVWSQVRLAAEEGLRNLPLGVIAGAGFDMAEWPFQRGDMLLLYTDGVIEAPGDDDELFGIERLLASANEAGDAEPMELKSHILRRLRQWSGGRLSHDDVTLVAIQLE